MGLGAEVVRTKPKRLFVLIFCVSGELVQEVLLSRYFFQIYLFFSLPPSENIEFSSQFLKKTEHAEMNSDAGILKEFVKSLE